MESERSPQENTARGVKSLTAQDFDMLDSVGGVRGLVEAIAPGLIYLVVYVTTGNLTPALISSLSVAVLLVVLRLIQRTPVTMAFSGIFGVAIGLFVAWRSGDASDFYVWGLLVNIAYLVVLALSNVVKWPGVGVMVEILQSGLGATSSSKESPAEDASTNSAAIEGAEGLEAAQSSKISDESTDQPALVWPTAWRKDADLMHRYTVVTWIWVAMFAARLIVQGPLYLAGESAVAALGTARLIMGLPLFALVLWLSWRIIRQPAVSAAPQD
ncbi:DUF3159 domain-containing protein [Timonella senegalensis]|uniref:DUF3159 domain-containing protein n=1 Tax=Timonella senegalensis TaxID=1465825 RepID=UPI001C578C83|nr:DUF3159 domain-containing protein [Timonella senegalensis]